MNAPQPNLLELAKQGNARAIAALMNRVLQPKGVTIKSGLASDCLMIMAESQVAPDQFVLANFVRKSIESLHPQGVRKVVIQARETGKPAPVWHEMFDLVPLAETDVQPIDSATTAVSEPLVDADVKTAPVNEDLADVPVEASTPVHETVATEIPSALEEHAVSPEVVLSPLVETPQLEPTLNGAAKTSIEEAAPEADEAELASIPLSQFEGSIPSDSAIEGVTEDAITEADEAELASIPLSQFEGSIPSDSAIEGVTEDATTETDEAELASIPLGQFEGSIPTVPAIDNSLEVFSEQEEIVASPSIPFNHYEPAAPIVHPVTATEPKVSSAPVTTTRPRKNSKLLLVAGASAITLALCFGIGRQLLTEPLSANVLSVTEQDSSTAPPDASKAAIDPQPEQNSSATTDMNVAAENSATLPVAPSQPSPAPTTKPLASSQPKPVAVEKPTVQPPKPAVVATSNPGSQPKSVSLTTTKEPRPISPAKLAAITQPPASGQAQPSNTTISKAVFRKQIVKGMTYAQVSKVIGGTGQKMSTAGRVVTYKWITGQGNTIIATFLGDQLISKSQIGLK